MIESKEQTCVVIGASHAGVNFAFSLRKEGWQGKIILFDVDPHLPYHRPPLSKAFLTSEAGIENYLLKPEQSYQNENIELHLGKSVISINRDLKEISVSDGHIQPYDKLVIATGARALEPNIVGLSAGAHVCYLRTAADVLKIKKAYGLSKNKKVVIIGGGYIGLEIAASLKKLGASVVILERELRILSRVTSPEMSAYFYDLHAQNGVEIYTNKQVVSVETSEETKQVTCQDGSEYLADLIIVGVGVRVNSELAQSIGLEIENGIKVNEYTQTSDSDIYAIGDCTSHFNPHYGRFVRLESVQNAVDQGKVAAAAISGKLQPYNSIPWFWSDQYDTKLQIVGLADGYDDLIMREDYNQKRSVWYFKGEKLLSVDAINNAKAYVIGTKVIKENKYINKSVLSDISIPLNYDLLTS